MVILTLNCGSSSVKYQLYDWVRRDVLAKGAVERVCVGNSFIRHRAKGEEEKLASRDCRNHREAIELILETILGHENGAISSLKEIKAVGHRVVHGGARFDKSLLIDDEVICAFEGLQHLAPLHLPANLTGIQAARQALPEIPHCAVMDTTWHQTIPRTAYMYALPYGWYADHGVRRYGFHGTSFLYCAKRASVLLGADPFAVNAILCHIGNGSSVCAVRNGISVDTSMGLTPLEGLVMGTRSGDCDPAIGFYMIRQTGMSPDRVEAMMNRESGLLGITGDLIDRRDIVAAADQGNERARLAVDMETYRLKKYIGAYCAVLGRLDALVFTGGVGEMQPIIREGSLDGLEDLGISLDRNKNRISMTRNAETELTGLGSRARIFVVPTDEELVMAEDTYALVHGTYDVHAKFEYSFQRMDYVNRGRQQALKQELERSPELRSVVAATPQR